MDEHREELLALFYEVDPWGLRDILREIDEDGLPDDEYSPEVDRISDYAQPTAADVLRIFVSMGSESEPDPEERVEYGSYPAVSKSDAEALAAGIARIRAKGNGDAPHYPGR